MKKSQKLAVGFGAAAVLLGGAGAVAAANTIGGGPAPQGQALVTDQPGTGPETPGQVEVPEPGDTPDGPGQQ
jgi:hypothetical protein